MFVNESGCAIVDTESTDLLPGMVGDASVHTVVMADCKKIKSVAVLATLPNLTSVDMRRCTNVLNASALVRCATLKHLDMAGYNIRVRNLNFMEGCMALTRLDISGCIGIEDVSVLATFTGLTTLHMNDCPNVKDISAVGSLPDLEDLSIAGCIGIVRLIPVARCKALEVLNIVGCTGVVSVAPLAFCERLRQLHMSNVNAKDIELVMTARPSLLKI